MRVHTSNERIFVVVVSDIVPSRIYVIHRLGSPYCEKLYSIEGKGFPNTDRPGWRITFLLFSRKKTSPRSCNKPPWFAGNIAGNNLVRYRNQSNFIFLLCISQFQQCPSPPRADPRELAFFENELANAPPPGQKSCSNAPGRGSKMFYFLRFST